MRALTVRHAAPPLLVAAALLAWACSGVRPGAPARDAGWQPVGASSVPGKPDLCEDRREASRLPHGDWDRIALRRLARCDDSRETADRATQVFYLPGTHMNGSLAVLDERHEFRLYLARRGVVVWSLDYRTHFVPPETNGLDYMSGWTWQVFLADAAAALEFVRRETTGPIVVAGFSLGASFASALAGNEKAPLVMSGDVLGSGGERAAHGIEHDRHHPLAGLALLDGVAPGMLPAAGASRAMPVAIDVGSSRLSFARRQALLAAVIADAHAPSTNREFSTVGHELAHLLYTSATFGGRGGLSDALHGRADIAHAARLLASYDRFWPGAATRSAAVAGDAAEPASPALITLPAFAVTSTNMGEGFRSAVEASARRLGGDTATIIVLPGWGHLDVLVGTSARDQVFAPFLRWLRALSSPSAP